MRMRLERFRAIVVILILLVGLSTRSFSQNCGLPPPPPPSGNHGTTSSQSPGSENGAPVGNGTWVLIGMAAIYAARKAYTRKKVSDEDSTGGFSI